MLPWIQVPQNKVQRARVNAAYGAPLKKVYPPGVFFVSNTGGAPGQSNTSRVFSPGQNQTGDPRAQGGFYNLDTSLGSLAGLITPTFNVGGNVEAGPSKSDYSPYLLAGVVILIVWGIFK